MTEVMASMEMEKKSPLKTSLGLLRIGFAPFWHCSTFQKLSERNQVVRGK